MQIENDQIYTNFTYSLFNEVIEINERFIREKTRNSNFKLKSWQKKSLERLANESFSIITAPTGGGKTIIPILTPYTMYRLFRCHISGASMCDKITLVIVPYLSLCQELNKTLKAFDLYPIFYQRPNPEILVEEIGSKEDVLNAITNKKLTHLIITPETLILETYNDESGLFYGDSLINDSNIKKYIEVCFIDEAQELSLKKDFRNDLIQITKLNFLGIHLGSHLYCYYFYFYYYYYYYYYYRYYYQNIILYLLHYSATTQLI